MKEGNITNRTTGNVIVNVGITIQKKSIICQTGENIVDYIQEKSHINERPRGKTNNVVSQQV